MWAIALGLVCLACPRDGRRLQQAQEPGQGTAGPQHDGGSLDQSLNDQPLAESKWLQSSRRFEKNNLAKFAIVLPAFNPTAEAIESQGDEKSEGTFTRGSNSTSTKVDDADSDKTSTLGDGDPRFSESVSIARDGLSSWLKNWRNSWRSNEARGGSNESEKRSLVSSRQLPLAPVGSRWPSVVPVGSPWISAARHLSHLLPWISLLFSKQHAAPDWNFAFARGGTHEEANEQAGSRKGTTPTESVELRKARERISELEENLAYLQSLPPKQGESEMQMLAEKQSHLLKQRELEIKALMEKQSHILQQKESEMQAQAAMQSHLLKQQESEIQALEEKQSRLLKQLNQKESEMMALSEKKASEMQAMGEKQRDILDQKKSEMQALVEKQSRLLMQKESEIQTLEEKQRHLLKDKESEMLALSEKKASEIQALGEKQRQLLSQKDSELQALVEKQSRLLMQKESEMQALAESFQDREDQLKSDQVALMEQINERIDKERKDVADHYQKLLQSRERQLQATLAAKTRLLERKDADSQAMAANFKAYEEKLAHDHEDLLEKVDVWQMQYQQVSQERAEMQEHYMKLLASEKQWQSKLDEKDALLEQKAAENQAKTKNFKKREQQLEEDCEELLEKINIWQMQYQHVNIERNEIADQYQKLESKESRLQSMLQEKARLLEEKEVESHEMAVTFKTREEQLLLDREELLEKIDLWQVQYHHVDSERKAMSDQYAELESNEARLHAMLQDKTSLVEQKESELAAIAKSFQERETELEEDREELRKLLQSREWQMQTMLEDKTRLLEQKDVDSEQLVSTFQAREEQLEHDQKELSENIKFWQSQYEHVEQERNNIEDQYKDLLRQKDSENQAMIDNFQAQEAQSEHEHNKLQEKMRLWKVNYQRINRQLNKIVKEYKELQSDGSRLQSLLEERTQLSEQTNGETQAMVASFQEREEQLEHDHKELQDMINFWQIRYQHMNRERIKMEEQFRDDMKLKEAENSAKVGSVQARKEQLEHEHKEMSEKLRFWKIHYQRVNKERIKIEDGYKASQSNEARLQSILEEKTRLFTLKDAEGQAEAKSFKAREEQLQLDCRELQKKIDIWQTQYQRINQERSEIEAHYFDVLLSKEGNLPSKSRLIKQTETKLFRARVEQLERDREELSDKMKLWKMNYQRVSRERSEIEGQFKDLLAWREGRVQSMVEKSDEHRERTLEVIEQGMKSLEAVEAKLKQFKENERGSRWRGFGLNKNTRQRKLELSEK